jgi:hypothetical protein
MIIFFSYEKIIVVVPKDKGYAINVSVLTEPQCNSFSHLGELFCTFKKCCYAIRANNVVSQVRTPMINERTKNHLINIVVLPDDKKKLIKKALLQKIRG